MLYNVLAHLYFGMLSVDKRYQGYGLGLGIIRFVEEIGRVHGFDYIELHVVNLREDLHPWYEKLGYKRFGKSSWPENLKHELKQDAYFIHMQKMLK